MQVEAKILCGGAGTRLWPVSTEGLPKQFIDLLGAGEPLIVSTVRRVRDLVDRVDVITSPAQSVLVRERLADVGLVIEPMPRNTAAAIGLAAIRMKPEDVMAVFPCDHRFAFEDRFRQTVAACIEAAKQGGLVTMGLKPTWGHPELGYIEAGNIVRPGLHRMIRFREKPTDAAQLVATILLQEHHQKIQEMTAAAPLHETFRRAGSGRHSPQRVRRGRGAAASTP